MKKKLAILLLSLPISSQALANGDLWSSSKLYEKGDSVSHEGTDYSAKFGSRGIPPKESTDWRDDNPWKKKNDDGFPAEAFHIVEPSQGRELFTDAILDVVISASRSDIESIIIELNGKLIAEMTSQPFSYAFMPDVLPGDATLTVIAKYNGEEQVQVRNITFISRFITDEENEGEGESVLPETPAHFITPQNAQSFDLGETVLIKLGVPESEETTPIEIFDNNALVATMFSQPFELPWIPQYAGVHQLMLIQRIDNQDIISTIDVNVTEKIETTHPLRVTSNIAEDFIAEVNKEMTLSATVLSGSPEYLRFLIDGEELVKFDSPPYTLKWIPTQVGYYEFSIKGRNKNKDSDLNLFRRLIPALSKEGMAYCKETPIWEAGILYSPQDTVQHKGEYFTAYRYNAEEPKYYSNGAAASGHAWNKNSCQGMVQGTNPGLFFRFDKEYYNPGDTANLEVHIGPYPRDSISTKEVTITDELGRIKRLTKPPFIYTRKIEQSRIEVSVKVTNSLGISDDAPAIFDINTPPAGNINFQQGYGSSIVEGIPFDIVVMPRDMDGWVKYIEFYIDGVKVDEKYVSTSARYVRSTQTLSAGEYEVKATLFDNNNAKTDLIKMLRVNAK